MILKEHTPVGTKLARITAVDKEDSKLIFNLVEEDVKMPEEKVQSSHQFGRRPKKSSDDPHFQVCLFI